MKKNYFLKTLMGLLMLVALPAKAQLSSMVDLYGKYTFTADMEVTAEGESLKDNFTDNCEVTISKDNSGIGWDAVISGIAGAVNGTHNVNGIDTDNKKFKIQNWNGSNSSLWNGGIWMSNAEGIYPFGWGDMPQLEELFLTYDADTKNISIPEFTLVTVDHAAGSATVVARFKNAKLTFVEGESLDIMDLSGDWHFKAGEGAYDVKEDSELPTEFDMVITKKTDDNKNYTIDLTYHTYPTVQLEGSFNGVTLTVPLDSTVLDAEKGIYLCNTNGFAYSDLEFSVVSESVMSSSYIGIAQHVAEPAEGEADYTFLQYLRGTAKKAETDKFDWAGTFKVVANTVIDADPSDDLPMPGEFDMVVEYFEATDAYYIVNFWGNDVKGLNYGGIRLTVNPENSKEATIATGGFVASIIPGELYCKLYDGLGENGTIPVKVNEDGTISIGDFFIKKENFTTGESTPGVFYQEVTATKAAAEEPVELTWDGTYTVTADVTMQGEGDCPSTFEMVVDYLAEWDMYLVTKFMGNDVTSANYGGISFTPAENTATIKTNSFVKTVEAGVLYYKMFDANGGSNPLEVTRAEDGSLTIADFTVYTMAYDENWNAVLSEQPIAIYTNVKAVKNPTAIESVKKDFSKVTVNGGVISIEGGAQPVAVYDITGRMVFSGVASQVPVAKGLHIVKVGSKAVKVNVK